MRHLKKGFTLIELIIVMAVLGILAAGLIAALNPVEQINRGNDSSLNVTSKAIFDAMNRFYAQQGYQVWCASSVDAACTDISAGVASNSTSWLGSGGTVQVPTAGPELRLESTGELKSAFLVPVKSPASIIVSGAGTTAATAANPVVCYAPKSLAQIATATFNSTGGAWSSGTKYNCLK